MLQQLGLQRTNVEMIVDAVSIGYTSINLTGKQIYTVTKKARIQ